MNASIYFSAHSNKALEVTRDNSIKEICSIIENIKVRNILISPSVYTPKFKETYRLELIYSDNNVISINLLNKKFIEINRKTYKIVNSQDLSKIYEVIILDQDKEKLDEFYYNLIRENK